MTTELSPEMLYDEFRRARLFLEAGQPTEAARIVHAVVDAAPDNTAALELLARALFASAQLSRAEDALRTLTDRCPDDEWAHVALARTLERLGRGEEAAAHHRLAEVLGRA
jgi:Flp pilus assembly protein TadD